jgi:hypothetical protein
MWKFTITDDLGSTLEFREIVCEEPTASIYVENGQESCVVNMDLDSARALTAHLELFLDKHDKLDA